MDYTDRDFNPETDLFFDNVGLPAIRIQNFTAMNQQQKGQLKGAIKKFLKENVTGGKMVRANSYGYFNEVNSMEFWRGWFGNKKPLADIMRDGENTAHIKFYVPLPTTGDDIYQQFLQYARNKISYNKPSNYADCSGMLTI